ncbi:hypothetical protein EDC44_11025 [Cricetibacter osteomyelitidis]|uniref:Uncharacterized protein n=1 Tax=Cricetibacter osteomyelitidis TaxID=1521931 RepID=A0A4R2T2Y8_9PAST|nr:hypothetical protein [Cricetibacter osteomyelitidis]TCP95194.1 hypothetical protein EDC44_11025 [Cricetibacter osteomyelitidis]
MNSRQLEKLYERCIQNRNLEIEQLVQRNNFFILFQGILFTSISTIATSGKSIPVLLMILILVGIIMSWFQWKGAAGAKFWQEYWEARLFKIEQELNECLSLKILFNEKEPKQIVSLHLEQSKKSWLTKKLILSYGSVSSIPIYIGLVCLYIWIFLFGFFLSIYYSEIFNSIITLTINHIS